jgi:putative transposase
LSFHFSLRDIAELLFEPSVAATHETVRRWCDKVGASVELWIKAKGVNP